VKKFIFIAWWCFQTLGFVFASYGVLRESFATTAIEAGVGLPGVFQRGVVEAGIDRVQEALVNIGLKSRLLPQSKELSLQDRKRNAAFAVLGVLLVSLSIILDLVYRLYPWSWRTAENSPKRTPEPAQRIQ
jgi:hypothetical protein